MPKVSIEGTGIGVVANSSGRFLLQNVPAGQQTVKVVLIGFNQVQQDVTVTVGQAASVEIELSPTAISLNEIVVTGVGAETTPACPLALPSKSSAKKTSRRRRHNL